MKSLIKQHVFSISEAPVPWVTALGFFSAGLFANTLGPFTMGIMESLIGFGSAQRISALLLAAMAVAVSHALHWGGNAIPLPRINAFLGGFTIGCAYCISLLMIVAVAAPSAGLVLLLSFGSLYAIVRTFRMTIWIRLA